MNKNRKFFFHNCQSPNCFRAELQEKALQANLKLEQSENEFCLHIDSHHGGQVFYKARISAGDGGGSLIEGEIITIPWDDGKSRTKFQKVMEVIGYILGGIVMSPIIILIFLFLGCYELFLRIKNKGRKELPRDEINLMYFMVTKLLCSQIIH